MPWVWKLSDGATYPWFSKSRVPARDVPSHGSSGVGHIAFAAKPEELDTWRKQLREPGIPIELEMDWEGSGPFDLFL
jgi:hypothetical protein